MKSFKDIREARGDTAVFTFGRFNPPTTGHEKLLDAVAKQAKKNAGAPYYVFASHSENPKKDPLPYAKKVAYMKKMFPKHSRSIFVDKARQVFEIAVTLHNKGHKSIVMVVGSDRVTEFDTLLNKYNGVEGRHGYYGFDNIEVVSAGERDPDAEGVTGMSASKMRAAAAEGDAVSFAKGVPRGYDSKDLFNTVRKAMGIKESPKFREHVELPKVSNTREEYVEGNLFSVGDEVVLKETSDVGVIKVCGTNYLVVEFGQWKKRVWLDQVELMEKCGAGEDGTDELLNTYKNDTPGEEPGPIKLKSFKDMQEKGLWDNIHKKRKSGRKMNPKGHPDAPTEKEIKAAQGKKKK